jgi:hypothetical protein
LQRQSDGSTAPAPPLSIDGTAVVNGKTITAIREQGTSDDFDPRARNPLPANRPRSPQGAADPRGRFPAPPHRLYALGFQSSDSRVLVHAVLGCLFYGVFVTKMLLLTVRRVGPFPSQVACSS